ncbi:MAG: ATP-binding protein [Akkermansiaceae bacterium]|jgi:two-component system phosphate regulon sensor histidine kinase PhoR|nr:ATP-binding protein [Akkermansiaceae bacterium]
MPEISATLAAIAVAAAMFAVFVLALRLRRARREFQEEVRSWKSRLAEDLKRARHERDGLLNALAEAFLMVDASGSIRFANQSAIRMFGGRQLLDRSVPEVMLDHNLASAVLDCLHTGLPVSRRIVLQNSPSPSESRPSVVFDLDAAPLPDPVGGDPSIRVVIRNVSAEHHTEQVRKDFVANASHELRTPLAIINGYLENLIDDDLIEDPAMARRFLTIMRKHTERIARIVEDMLVISRLESGEAAALKIEPFRMRSCFQDVLERLESVIQGQEAKVSLEMPDPELNFCGDRFYWTQVLFNLVENALKQNPRKGLNISLGCQRKDDALMLWVADDGVGIPSQDLPHIFRRFYRVEKHHSQDQIKGTGLGLSIVKRAVEAHGGTIQVSSTPGEDTRFTIRIPAQAEESLKSMVVPDPMPLNVPA